MNRLLSFVSIIAVVLAIGSAPAAAQQSEAAAIYQRYGEVFAAGDYAAALIEAQKYEAAVKAQWGVNHINYAAAHGNIANVYFKQARYAEAEDHHKRALAIGEQAGGAGRLYVAISLFSLATVHDTQGKYAEAEVLFKRALAIFERASGANDPRVATTSSTTWRSCTRGRAGSPTRRGSTSARWRSASKPLAPAIPPWPCSSTTWPSYTRRRANTRRRRRTTERALTI